MPDDATKPALPAAASEPGVPAEFRLESMPLTLRIMLNPVLFEQVKAAAKIMSDSGGFVGQHLEGKPQACFAVITRSMDWRLDPYFVAQATYQTPNGAVGFEGKLCQAILENSGRIVGGIKYEHYGDWSKIIGRFKIVKNARGNDVPAAAWNPQDEDGLGVTVVATVRGESEPRRWSIDLDQAYPRNSPLWATDPRSQICYLAVRRFGDLAVPGIYGGVRFSVDDFVDASEMARDVTPPQPQAVAAAAAEAHEGRRVVEPEQPHLWIARDHAGNELALKTPERCIDAIAAYLEDAVRRGTLDTAWEQNEPTLDELRRAGFTKEVLDIEERFAPPPAGYQPPKWGGEADARASTEAQERDDGWPGPDDTAAEPEQAHPAPPEQGAEASEAPAANDAHPEPQAAADPYWSNPTEVAVPRRPKGGWNWAAYADHITRLIATAPNAEAVAAFRRANRQIGNLRLSYLAGYEEFEAAEKRALSR